MTRKRILPALAVIMAAFVALASPLSRAAEFAEDACDSNIMESMKARAMLESMRETEQNQNLVFKNDSTLEYTCFPQFASYTQDVIAGSLSETTDWGAVPERDGQATDRALESAVIGAIGPYLQTNFSHTYLGGRVRQDPGDANAGGNYVCDAMAFVWSVAKCWNFMTDEQDGFFSFEQYRDMNDVRRLPMACQKDTRWGDLINTALSKDAPWYPDFEKVTQDDVFEPIHKLLVPGECTDPILAGIQVTDTTGAAYADGVCSNPGCLYTGTGCAPR